jgi:hypothetical protein
VSSADKRLHKSGLKGSRYTHLSNVNTVWIVIQTVIINNLNVIITFIVITSLISLYYYLSICYSGYFILWALLRYSRRFISVVVYGLRL